MPCHTLTPLLWFVLSVFMCVSVCLFVCVVRRVDTVVLVALAVGAVTDRLTLSRDESKVLEFIENIRNKQERKIAAAKMLQHGWRAYYTQRGKKDAQSLHDPMGVPENSILSEPLFYKAALQYAQMRSESVNGFYHTHTHTHTHTENSSSYLAVTCVDVPHTKSTLRAPLLADIGAGRGRGCSPIGVAVVKMSHVRQVVG